MVLNVVEHIPRMCCRDEFLKKLRSNGIQTTGYEAELEAILTEKGLKLPERVVDGDRINFIYWENERFHSLLNYSDACANKIINFLENNL